MSRWLHAILCVALLAMLAGGAFAQNAAESARWNQDPRSMGLNPTGSPAPVVNLLPNPEDPTRTDRVIQGKNELFVLAPTFRPRPSTRVWQTEVIVVRHPFNQNIMWGSSNAVTFSPTFISEGLYLTTDGGTTWFGSDTINSAPITGHSGDPGPIIDKDGRLIITMLGGATGMQAAYSTDMGVTWSANVSIPGGSSSDKNLANTDDVPTSPYYGRSYVVWTNFGGTYANRIVISYTTNGGASWSTAAPVSPPTSSGHHHQGCDVMVGPNGDVHVVWANCTTNGQNSTEDSLGYARSTDGGVTWTYATNSAIDMNGQRAANLFNGIRASGFPRVSIDRTAGPRRGWIYVTTAEKSGGGAPPQARDVGDIIVMRSTDNGLTWTRSIANQDPAGARQYMSAIRVDEFGGVNVLYYDLRNIPTGDSAEVYISRSVDGGNTWQDIKVSDHRFRPAPISGLATGYQGDYIGITSGNAKLWPIWMSNYSGIYNAWMASVTVADPVDPNPPTNVRTLSDFTTPTSIQLRWTNPTTLVNGTPIPAFVMQIWRDGVLVTERPQTDTLYNDGGRTAYTRYNYVVRTRLTGNDSLSSDVQASWYAGGDPTPGAPRLDSIKTDTTRARIWWTNPTVQADGTPVHDLNFTRIWRNGVVIDSVPTATRTYTDLPPASGSPYTYAVQARNSLAPPRYSAASNTLQGRVPTYPADIAVTPASLRDSLLIAQVRGQTLSIQNAAPSPAEDLIVNLTETAPWLSLSRTRDTVLQGQTKGITVTFNAAGLTVGTYTTNITITANDPDEATTIVPVTLVVLPSPVIAVRPGSFSRNMQPSTTANDTLTIRNTGASALTWSLNDIPVSLTGAPARQPQADELYPPRYDLQGNRIEQAKGEADWYRGPQQTDGSGGPDSAGYRWVDSDEPGGPVFSWTDIRPVGTLITFPSTDDAYVDIPFPFQFPFYGQNYGTTLHVCTNGWVSFLINTSTSFSNTAIPNTSLPNLALYPWWDDLIFSSGTCHYYYDAANARFILQWTDVPGFTSGSGPYTFQIIMKQSGEILYQYLTMGGSILNSATIGIENQGGTVALQVVYNNNYIHNNMAIRIASDISWLTPTPTTGTVAVGDSAKVRLAYNTAGVPLGTYAGRLEINSNDYTRSPLNIPVALNVFLPGRDIGVASLVRPSAIDAPASIPEVGTEAKATERKSKGEAKEGGTTAVHPEGLAAEDVSFADIAAGTSPVVPPSIEILEVADTVQFRAIVQNFGTLVEPAYQVRWAVDGVVQGTLNNTDTLTVGDTDTLFFQWNTGTPGNHTARAWTVIGGDINPANDTASTSFSIAAPLPVLYDNGPLSTGTVTKSGVIAPTGYTWSEVQNPANDTTQSNTTAGFSGGITTTTRFRLADNFTVPAGRRWRIDSVYTWAYQTGATSNPFISANVRIWSGNPGSGTVVFGDTTTNRLGPTAGANMYRVFNTRYPAPGTVPGTTRPLWRNTILMPGLLRNPGTYWIDWQTQVTASAAHFAPSVTIVGRRGQASWDGLQYVPPTWAPALDTGNPATAPDSVQDFPFTLLGTSTSTGVADRSELPASFALEQNFPNPFNPSTQISYALPEQASVSLRVYDILGREVVTLFNGQRGAGYYTETWNGRTSAGSAVTSGVYFYRLEAKGVSGKAVSDIKKMVLMK